MSEEAEEIVSIGFVGLGIMGKPMAGHLIDAGFRVSVFNRSSAAMDELAAKGAQAATSLQELAESSELLITMLPNGPDVRDVLLDNGNLFEHMPEDAIWVDMSSIDPLTTRELALAAKAQGVSSIDAPVSGGEAGAINAALAIMAGGDAAAFARVENILRIMGKSVVLVGESGAGQTTKLVNQMLVAAHIHAMGEAYALAKSCGLDLAKTHEAIKDGLAGSKVLDMKTANLIESNFKPGFKMELHLKDLLNAQTAIEHEKLQLPVFEQVLSDMRQLTESGCAKEDHSSLTKIVAQR